MRSQSHALARAESLYPVLAGVGFAAFLGHTLFRWGGRPSTVYDLWLYNALIMLAVVGVAAVRCSFVRNEQPES